MYIKFEILQIVSPSEDVKFSNVRGLYLRKYGMPTVFLLAQPDFQIFRWLWCSGKSWKIAEKHANFSLLLLYSQIPFHINN